MTTLLIIKRNKLDGLMTNFWLWYTLHHDCTGVDLSKIFGGQSKILGRQKVVKSDKCMGVSQLLGGTCPGCPKKSTPMHDWAKPGFLWCYALVRRTGTFFEERKQIYCWMYILKE